MSPSIHQHTIPGPTCTKFCGSPTDILGLFLSIRQRNTRSKLYQAVRESQGHPGIVPFHQCEIPGPTCTKPGIVPFNPSAHNPRSDLYQVVWEYQGYPGLPSVSAQSQVQVVPSCEGIPGTSWDCFLPSVSMKFQVRVVWNTRDIMGLFLSIHQREIPGPSCTKLCGIPRTS